MVCSGACLAHCLVLPAVLVALPALSLGAAGSEAAHPWLLAMAAGAAGPALLAAGLAVGERAEAALTVAGSLAIVAAHLRNLRLRRRGTACR